MRSLHFLLVEDDPRQAEMIRHSIEGQPAPHTVTDVDDGSAALDYLRDAARDDGRSLPDVVLLDLDLPGRHGLEVLDEIKSHRRLRRVPVVILTSSEADADVRDAYDHHVNSYLVKPIEFSRLARLIEAVTSYWGELNRSPGAGADARES